MNTHIKAVRAALGDAGVRELEIRYGKPLRFSNWEAVPVREEMKIIELALDLLNQTPVPPAERAYDAGRLHFRNFAASPLGRILFGALERDFKLVMLRSRFVAQHVFRHTRFFAADLGPTSIRISIENIDYPIEHFRGFFAEAMKFFNLDGIVTAVAIPSGPTRRYEYTLSWKA